MKPKTINALLCRKYDSWLKSIDDDSLRERVNQNTMITGGCIVSMLLGEKVNDYDLYFRDKNLAFDLACYYRDKFNSHKPITYPIDSVDINELGVSLMIGSAGVAKVGKSSDYQYFETIPDQGESAEQYVDEVFSFNEAKKKSEELPRYFPLFVSANAITLKGDIQLVFRFCGEPEEIHKTYDFVHCTNYWASWDRKLYLNQPALESILSKELIYLNSRYPICAIIRTRKFIERGWRINAGQYLKMCYAVSELNLNNMAVLKDQLTGVDVAYFNQLIDALRNKQEADSDFKLEYTYLAKIIDKIF